MSDQSELQEAEKEIRIALKSQDVVGVMLSFYEARSEAEKLVFVAALAGRIMVHQAMNSVRATALASNSPGQ